jgi:hypothetical protein
LRILKGLRVWLFGAVGLGLPFYAFPIARLFGKPVDVATVFAASFVGISLLYRGSSHLEQRTLFLLGTGVLAPLLVLIPPGPDPFSVKAFATTYGHWLVVFLFFCFATSIRLTPRDQRRTAILIATLGTAVAFFALYQVVGILRHWPGTEPMLVPFQREALRFSWIGNYFRPMSIFLEPAWLGGYLTWVAVLAAHVTAGATTKGGRFLGSSAVGVMVLAIIATVSWGAYVNLAVVLIVSLVAFARHRNSIVRRPVALLATLLVIFVVVFFSPPAREVGRAVAARVNFLIGEAFESARLKPEAIDSTSVRALNLTHTLRLFHDHPWRGIGLGQFRLYEKEDRRLSRFPFSLDPWCGWLAIGAALGIAGPLILAFAIAFVAWRWLRADEPGTLRFAVPALLALAVVQQLHTASYIDLWWWYPLSLSAAGSSLRAHTGER